MKLTFILTTKNSADIISKTLNSVKNLVDEIIIIDNGSEDETFKIAKQFTDNVYTNKFHGHNYLARLRNEALSHSKGDWILSLDSDEVLSVEAQKIIPNLILESTYEGYWFRRKNYISRTKYLKYGVFYPDYQLSLFRNSQDYQFTDELHTRINVPKGRTLEVPVDILHFQQYQKYDSFSSIRNMFPYMQNDKETLLLLDIPIYSLMIKGARNFISLFFSGFFRGKGFLDGWAGFRAHVIFALSVGLPYFLAAKEKVLSK
jgi:glycosyltransferase involved in cell wall biosynthesis